MASTQCRGNAAVVVLGDIGRSPRMEYHCLSLLEENFNVDVIGYVETNPLYAIRRGYPKCKIHELSPVPITNLIPILKLFFKAIWQTISLLIALMSIRRPDFLLVQNPPCVPALLVCYIYSAVTRSKLVIDWHNYTYTILGLSAGEKSFLCGIAKRIERFCGQKANANICVTKAMKCDLQKNWNIRDITVLYDRPSARFHSIDLCRKHEIFMKLSKDYPQFLPKCYSDLKECGVIESTAFTQKQVNGKVVYKKQRMAILISSTSWTPDEDFSILIKALKEYEYIAVKQPNVYPTLLCIITGKGPLKEEYEMQISTLKWVKVSIITPWLEPEDYPTIIAAADLGVCLHWSSSGLDLPMKVVDMFGCCLPVCAYNFRCLNELVIHGKNGFIFENYKELAEQLKLWFKDFPNNPNIIETDIHFRSNLKTFQSLRWHENWSALALPVFNSFI